MRVVDLLVVYFAVGGACAIAIGRITRGTRATVIDRVLIVFLWPLYVPALLAPPPPSRPVMTGTDPMRTRIAAELSALAAAVEAVGSTPLRECLPTREQLDVLGARIDSLDAKVRELDGVLASEEFDPARASRAVEIATREGGALLESAQMVQRSIERLQSLRSTAARERDDLLALCSRLRTQLTVLRFTERSAPDELGGLVGEILVRVEAVGASLEAAIE